MNDKRKITELSADYYSLISGEHHKDRDCHWSIETKWSYGNEPRYIVTHNGYVYDRIEIICDTYEGALVALRNQLKNAVDLLMIEREAGIMDVPGELREAFEL